MLFDSLEISGEMTDKMENYAVPQRAKRKRLDQEHDLGEEESDINILSDFETSAVLNDSSRDTAIIHGKVKLTNCM